MEQILISPECEQIVLGSMFIDNSQYYKINRILTADNFAEPVHGRIFSLCAELIESGQQANPPVLKHKFENEEALSSVGGSKYLGDLAKTALPSMDVVAAATVIRDMWLKRQAMMLCEEFRAELENQSAFETMGKLSQDFQRILSSQTNRFDDAQSVSISVVDSLRETLPCHKTGFKALDEAMGGGLYEGKAYALCARKKQGKTLLTASISHDLNMAGVPHLFIACEMSPEEIQQRNMARVMGCNALAFINDRSRNDPDFCSRAGVAAMSIPKNAYYLKGWHLTFDQLKTEIIHACVTLGIKGFILDYIQLIGGKPAKQSQAEFMDGVSQWIAEICRTRGIFALVVAQINQEGNVRGSESIRLAFDQVYQLHRCVDKQENILNEAWIEMMDTRYTDWYDIGSNDSPGLILNTKVGPMFEEV